MTVRKVKRRDQRRLVIDIVYFDTQGRRRRYRRDAQVQILAAAQQEERRLLQQLAITGKLPRTSSDSGESPSSPSIQGGTFRAAVDQYKQGQLRLKKPSTRRGYEAIIDGILEPKFGSRYLDEITAREVVALDVELAADGRRASTRRNVIVVLRAVLRAAAQSGMLANLPKMPPLPKVGQTVPSAMTWFEFDLLTKEAPAALKLAIFLAGYAGLRAGEVRGLRWSDIDFKEEVLVVRRSICQGEESPPKSGHERAVPLAAALLVLLQYNTIKKPTPWSAVSPNPKGQIWGEHELGRHFRALCKRLELQNWRFHDLRHFFVTELFRQKNSAPVVQRLAGHAVLITTQRYAHATREEARAAIGSLGRGNMVVTAEIDAQLQPLTSQKT